MGLSKLGSPETTPHGNDGELGHDDGAADGGGDLLAALHAEPDVAVVVADGNEGLKAGTLTGTGLFLNGHDFEDFVFQRGAQKEIDDFEFLLKVKHPD